MSVRRILGGLLVLILGASACGQRDPAQSMTEASPATPSRAPAPGRFSLEDCPIEDEAFCKVAVEAVNAIAAGDAEALMNVSRPGRFMCGLPSDLCTPGTGSADGYLFVWGGSFPPMSSVLSETSYVERLEALFASTDPSFTDEYGDGAIRILGVSECGGGWALHWTAAASEGGGQAERVVGQAEFVYASTDPGGWYTEGVWISPIEIEEVTVAAGPVSPDDVGCATPATPWPMS